ncbi:MAG: protein kinase [Polyangia bacterium]
MTAPAPKYGYCPSCRTVQTPATEHCPNDGTRLELVEQVLAGRFVLRELIGAGSMGTVHRATQLPMGREVAVKLMHTELVRNPDMVARFEREALAASTVDHPNAITIYDSGRTEDGQVYIAMEFLQGETLAAQLLRLRRLPAVRALELWTPAVKAMVVAHRKGIVHRDLKPDNIFIAKKVNEEGQAEEIVKVLDFGIAKILQGTRQALKTVAGTRIGTALYMSPEQLEGREASKASDVYALGLILMELITGRIPWGKTGEESDAVLTMLRLVNPPSRLCDLCPDQPFSSQLQALFDAALALDPSQRPADAGELLKRLAHVPEAAFLAQKSTRRSDVSQMFSAELMSAVLDRDPEPGSPSLPQAAQSRVGGPLSAGPATQPLPSALRAQGGQLPPTTLPMPVPAPLPQSTPTPTELTALPTVVTGSAAADTPQSVDLQAVPTQVTGAGRPFTQGPLPSAEELPGVPTQVTSASLHDRASEAPTDPRAIEMLGLASTLPAKVDTAAKPRAGGVLVKQPPRGNDAVTRQLKMAPEAETKQLPRARAPVSGRSPSPGPSPSPSPSPSSETVRPVVSRQRWLGPALVGLLLSTLLGIGYVLLHMTGGPQPPPPSDATVEPARSETPPVVDAAVATPRPPRPPSELQISFVRRRLGISAITCGEPPRPCEISCSLRADEGCAIRGPKAVLIKRYSFAELAEKAKDGKARIELK